MNTTRAFALETVRLTNQFGPIETELHVNYRWFSTHIASPAVTTSAKHLYRQST